MAIWGPAVCSGPHANKCRNSASDQGSRAWADRESGIFGPKPCGGPCADLPRSFGIILSPQSRNPTMLVNHFHEQRSQNSKTKFNNKYENKTVRASLENQGPRDRVCVKEREKFYRSHRSRGLYDQMAPQLYQCYVPGNRQNKYFVKDMVWWVWNHRLD